MIKRLLFAFFGIFVGKSIVCTVFILIKDPDYMRFWNYMGYFYLPIYEFIYFLLPFMIYLAIFKLFKKQQVMNKWDFLVIGFLFSLGDTLVNAFLITPFERYFAQIVGNQTVKFFIRNAMLWIIVPLILFWSVCGIHIGIKKIVKHNNADNQAF